MQDSSKTLKNPTLSLSTDSLAGVARVSFSVPPAVIGFTIFDDWNVEADLFWQLVILKSFTVASVYALIPFTYSRSFHKYGEWLLLLGIALILASVVTHAYLQSEPIMSSFSAIIVVVMFASVMPWKVKWQMLLSVECLSCVIATHWLTYTHSFWPIPKMHLISIITICFPAMVLMVYTVGRQAQLAKTTDRLYASEEQARELAGQLQELASTDYLTGAGNVRGFYDRVRGAIDASQVNARPLSLVLIDLDFFKQINDQYGHAAGDQILKQFVYICTHFLTGNASLFRIGGEEFVLLLPELTMNQAVQLADEMRIHISEQNLIVKARSESINLRVTASMGVTQIESSEKFVEPAMERCDWALYEAKNLGRNKVRSAAGLTAEVMS